MKYDKVNMIIIIGFLQNMIKCNMINILKSRKYDKMQYDKVFGIFYHIDFGNMMKKKTNGWGPKSLSLQMVGGTTHTATTSRLSS